MKILKENDTDFGTFGKKTEKVLNEWIRGTIQIIIKEYNYKWTDISHRKKIFKIVSARLSEELGRKVKVSVEWVDDNKDILENIIIQNVD